MSKDQPAFVPDNLLAGDFPRVSKLVWFKKECHLKPGAIVCSKFSLGDDESYVLLDGTLIGKVIDKVKDIVPNIREGLIDKVADLVRESADLAITKIKHPLGILAEEVHAEHEDVQAAIWITGTFNKDAVYMGEGLDFYAVKKVLRDSSIFLKEVW